VNGMRSHIASRLRSSSLSAVPPRPDSSDYSADLARAATSILYRSPIPSKENRPIYILNAAALPDSKEADFDSLLPYVLARLPEEDDLLRGYEYEVVFFAGDDGSVTQKKNRPGWGWFLQAYHVLSRAMRKRLQRLYIVHEKAWVRILAEIFSTIASPKFRRKIVHASTLTNLALYIPIEELLIPPSTYLHDRRISDDIFAPYASGRRAYAARVPFPVSKQGKPRFPRVLREATSFLLLEPNIVTEGLFRVPPHAKLREVLMEAYDRGQKFIIWKDNGSTLDLPKYPNAQNQDEIISEIDPRDAYSVHMAAALIKAWYAGLRQPIFPAPMYKDLKRLFGDPDEHLDVYRLKDLISPSSQWSFLPAVSREIMTRHLLPLLSSIAAHQDHNKMTPENLAVCLAPTLLCGPDQLEDAKMSSIVRRILTQAITLWPSGLCDACGIAPNAFIEDLRLPKDMADWEDPVEGYTARQGTLHDDEHQVTGIVLQDNENIWQPLPLPPLPPRSSGALHPPMTGPATGEAIPRRKPVPSLQAPPRYSTIISDPSNVSQSPTAYTLVATNSPCTHQDDHQAEGKTGTNCVHDSLEPPQIVLPKRKALTAEQIDNAEHAAAQIDAGRTATSTAPPFGHPSPHFREILEAVTKKAPTMHSPTAETGSHRELRRPSWPVQPSITSLARPVHPAQPVSTRPPSKSTSLPIPGMKPRTPSPGLLRKMPSFEASTASKTLRRPAGKLDVKKVSVDDLRRLYEERAGTAKTLVEVGKRR
ncbi:hypothetical protein M011DRAFT_412528, partial [Sporormia fimetaria CBS 119925]